MRRLLVFLAVLVLALSCLLNQNLYAQVDVNSSQFMNTQLFINPGYTGIQKALNVVGMARQQWVGIEGAPKRYQVGFDSPINKSMSGIGGGIQIEQYGPYKMNLIHANYSRMIKISGQSFLSFGLTGVVSNYSLGLGDLVLNHPNDPNFIQSTENAFAVNVGVGAFYFTENYYIGLSAPKLLNEKPFSTEGQTFQEVKRYYYLSGGYIYNLNKKVALKPSLLLQMQNEGVGYVALGSQVVINNRLWLGAMYQTQKWVSALVNLQVSNSLNLGYSFDFGVSQTLANLNSHEVTLRYSIFSLYKKNKNRNFKRKRKKKSEDAFEESMKNLRHF